MLLFYLLFSNLIYLSYHEILYKSDQSKKDIFYCYLNKVCEDICPKQKHYSYKNLRLSLVENQKMAVNGLYRPRSALARAIYEKQRNDRLLEEFDQTKVTKQL